MILVIRMIVAVRPFFVGIFCYVEVNDAFTLVLRRFNTWFQTRLQRTDLNSSSQFETHVCQNAIV